MRRRVFLSGAILTGVGVPLLAGCKLPWKSKPQAGSTSAASASASGAQARKDATFPVTVPDSVAQPLETPPPPPKSTPFRKNRPLPIGIGHPPI